METQTEQPFRRVAVMGMPGSGKSTFAVRLGEALDAPVHHLDAIYWKTSEPAEWEEFRAEQAPLLALNRWVLDGNYSSGGSDERLARADAVVFLDVSRGTALRRILWRALRRHGSNPSAHGNPSGLDWEFIRWVWNWKRDHPDFVESLQRKVKNKPLFVIRSRRDGEELLAQAGRRRSDAVAAT